VINRNELFSGPYMNISGYSYDITPDRRHFLLLEPLSKVKTSTRLKVVKNWSQKN
jgi:hypothetical protein